MNKWVAAVVIGVIAATFALDADAQRRFGGGKTFGRQSPQVQQRQATPPAAVTAGGTGTKRRAAGGADQGAGRRCAGRGSTPGQSLARRPDGAGRRPRHRGACLMARVW